MAEVAKWALVALLFHRLAAITSKTFYKCVNLSVVVMKVRERERSYFCNWGRIILVVVLAVLVFNGAFITGYLVYDADESSGEGLHAFMDYFVLDSDSEDVIFVYGACLGSDYNPVESNAVMTVYRGVDVVLVGDMVSIDTGRFVYNFTASLVGSRVGNYLAELNCSSGLSSVLAFDNFQIKEAKIGKSVDGGHV